MKQIKIGFYAFFVLFLALVLCYQIWHKEWLQMIFPTLMLLACVWAIGSVKKEYKDKDEDG